MLKHIFICLLVFATGLYAWEPPQPVSVNIEADDPAGYNTPFNVTVTVGLRPDIAAQGVESSDVALKVFLPPAMGLVSGELQWTGKLAAGEKKTFQLLVRTTISKPLVWDIGAVVTSNLLERPQTDRVSIYIEETRGRVLRNVRALIEKEPWLKEALGFKTMTITRDGKPETLTLPVMGPLQSTEDLGTTPLEEGRPHKLDQQEWLDYLNPSAKKQDSGAGGKIKAAPSPTRLADGICAFVGQVGNSMHYGIDGIKVELTMYGQVVDSCFTEGGGGGYYGFYYACPEYSDAPGVIIRLQTRWGDIIREPEPPYFYPYALSLSNYTKPQSWVYDFGSLDLSNWWDDYDAAGECFYELNRVSELTHYDFDFASVESVTVRYPVPKYGICGDGDACYNGNTKIMYVTPDAWNVVSHEYGHHIHYQKGAPDISNFNYGLNCSSLVSRELAYLEGWAEGFRDYVHQNSRENESCAAQTIRLVVKNRAAIWDLHDYGNDHEQCILSMDKLINGLGGGTEDILDYMDRLKNLYSSYSAQMDSVIDVNTLYDQTLLASAESPVLPKAANTGSELGQNDPNPFNPSTTISYSISGGESSPVKLAVYDIRGRRIKTLVSGWREPGKHTVFWDGLDEDGSRVASGVYFYRLEIGDHIQTRKMVILK